MICEGIHAIVTAARLGESKLTQALLVVYLKAVPSYLVLHGAVATLLRVLELASSKYSWKSLQKLQHLIPPVSTMKTA